MSNSYRRTPILGFGVSDKASKVAANRALRRKTRLAVKDTEVEVYPLIQEVSEVWRFRKSPRGWAQETALLLPKLMRK